MPAIRLPAEARDAPVDVDGLAMSVRLTPHQIAQLWRGEVVTASDAPIERLARALGCDVAALLVSSASTANDSEASAANDDRDPVYDDGPVMAAEPSVGAPAREPVDMGAMLERSLAQLVAESDGRYTDEDAGLVVDMLSAGDLPSSLTAREVPAFLRAWLEPAQDLRRLGRAQPNMLLTRVIEDAPKAAAKMAAGIRARVEQAKAPKTGAGKKPSKG